MLVSWNAVPGASHYTVAASREPSPNFVDVTSECCPVLPNGTPPCCPVSSAATSLQVEGLNPGVEYKFLVYAGSNFTMGPSAVIRTATVPSTPGPPSVRTNQVGVITLHWSAPATNGGSPIDGYRVVDTISRPLSHGAVRRTLVYNTSATQVQQTHISGDPWCAFLPLR